MILVSCTTTCVGPALVRRISQVNTLEWTRPEISVRTTEVQIENPEQFHNCNVGEAVHLLSWVQSHVQVICGIYTNGMRLLRAERCASQPELGPTIRARKRQFVSEESLVIPHRECVFGSSRTFDTSIQALRRVHPEYICAPGRLVV